MALKGCASCVKCLVFTFNLIFAITGIVLIILGLVGHMKDMTHFLDSKIMTAGLLLCLMGVVVFIVSICGCLGAIRESPCMLICFVVIMIILLLVELGAAIAMQIFQKDSYGFLKSRLNETLIQQKFDGQAIFDSVQKRLGCCGVEGPQDYDNVNRTGLPASCCQKEGDKGKNKEADKEKNKEADKEKNKEADKEKNKEKDKEKNKEEGKDKNTEEGKDKNTEGKEKNTEGKEKKTEEGKERKKRQDKEKEKNEEEEKKEEEETCSKAEAHKTGCYEGLLNSMRDWVTIIAAVASVVALFQIIAIVLALYLVCAINKKKDDDARMQDDDDDVSTPPPAPAPSASDKTDKSGPGAGPASA